MERWRNPSPRAMLALRVLGLALVLGLLWANVDWRSALGHLGQADPRWLCAACACLTIQTLLSAERWRITAGRLGITLCRTDAVGEYYLAQLANQALPGGVLGDASRAIRARSQAGLLASGQAVVFERAAGQIGLLAVFVMGLAGLILSNIHAVPWNLLAAVGAILAVTIAVLFAAGRIASVSRTYTDFAHAVTAPDIWRPQATLSLATALANVAAFVCCTAAVGASLSVLASVTLIPMILFAMVVPLSIGGWGLREGAAVMLFPSFGASMDHGLAASVAFGLVLLVSTLPGLAVLARAPRPRASQS